MKVLIRCDSSLLIGTGHLARCLTLGNYLQEAGHKVIFVSRDLTGNIIKIAEERQFQVIKLPRPIKALKSNLIYDHWLGVEVETETSQFLAIMDEQRPDWVVADHYGLPKSWEIKVKAKGAKLFVIDDILREHHADALLDQNIHENALSSYGELPNCQYFIGPEYALLSHDFLATPIRQRNFNEVKKLMIFFGGTDPTKETLKIADILYTFENIQIDVVAGVNNPSLPLIIEKLKDLSACTLHIQTKRMAHLMNDADLFLGAAGATTWERCYLGLPSIAVAVAENQIPIGRNLHELKVLHYLGPSEEIKAEDYFKTITFLIENPIALKAMNENSLRLNVSRKIQDVVNIFNN